MATQVATFGCRCEHLHSPQAPRPPQHTTHNTRHTTDTHRKAAQTQAAHRRGAGYSQIQTAAIVWRWTTLKEADCFSHPILPRPPICPLPPVLPCSTVLLSVSLPPSSLCPMCPHPSSYLLVCGRTSTESSAILAGASASSPRVSPSLPVRSIFFSPILGFSATRLASLACGRRMRSEEGVSAACCARPPQHCC